MPTTVVAHITASQGGATTPFTTPPLATTGADALIAYIGAHAASAGGPGTPTVSDSYGNTWVVQNIGEAGNVQGWIAYATGPPAPTVGPGHTLTIGNTAYAGVVVTAFRGIQTLAAPPDRGVAPSAPTAAATMQFGPITPGRHGEVLFGAWVFNQAMGSPPTVDSGFTRLDFLDTVGGVNFGIATAYFVQGAAALQGFTATMPVAVQMAGHLVSWYAAAAMPPPTPVLLTAVGGASQTGIITSSSIDTTGADTLVMVVAANAAAGFPAISDTYGNTWVLGPSGQGVASNAFLLYAKNAHVGAGHAFTFGPAGANLMASFGVLAFAGLRVDNPLGTTGGRQFLSATSVQASMTTARVNEVSFFGASVEAVITQPVVDSGFSLTFWAPGIAGTYYGSLLAYRVNATPGLVQPTASWTPATNGIAVWFTLYAPQAITRTPVAFQGQTAAARRATMRTLPTTTQAQTASFVWGWFRKLTVAATQATSAALSSGRAFLKAVTATQATTATIRRALGRTLAAVQGSAATRGLGRVLAAVQRLVASLTNIQDTAAFHSVVGITIDGVDVKGRVRMRTLTIHDALNDAPNTCALAIEAPQPKVGQRLRVTINAAHPQLLFDGPIDSVMTSYEGLPAQVIYNCTAGDDLVLLNRKRPFGAWTNVSATTVAQNLITQFGPGFTSTNVAPGLPVVSVVFDGTATFGACLQQLAKLIGGYFYVEDLDLHLFLAEPGTAPDPIDATHKFLDSPPITASIDTSQVRTRLYGKGHSEQVPCDVLANDTILPIADAVMFSQSPGGLAIVATTPDGAQHQRINYTDRRIGGASSFVGPGAAPSVAPTATGAFGSSALAVGATYQYAYTWVTAAGESRPSPTVPVTPGTLGSAGPANGPSPTQVTNFFNSDLVYGQQYNYACAWNYATGLSNGTLSALGPARSIVCDHWWNNSPPDGAPRYYTNGFQLYPPSGAVDARAKQLWIFRQVGGSWYYVGGWTVSNGTVGNQSAYDSASDAWCVGYNPPHGNPAQGTQPVNQFTVGGVAVGPSGTTIRRIYRTGANAAQLKLLATLSDNSTTAMAAPDNVADASLGVNAPTADTSGLVTQSGGQVLAGSTTIPTASAGPFPLAGWAFVGANWIRYTGISGNALTGVPASGPGSLVNTINYGEHIVVADVLLGVSQLNLPVLAGSSCAIWVQVDDVAAQANMQTLDGGDGIYEDTVVDERRAAISLGQLCQANLALYNNPIITITYATRDPKTKSGKRVVVTLDAPLAINQTLVIHTVDITEIDIAYATMPRFTVTASTVRYSLEDLLRQLATANNATTS